MDTPAVGEVAEVIYQAKNLKPGKRFGHYEIIEQIGAGGMGEVYLAEDKKLDRKVAVKILNQRYADHESSLDRFVQEARAVSALNHPNILVIHEVGEDENTHYIVSEFIKGRTLREILRESPLEFAEVLDVSIQIASALCAAHEANLVHRDIKPENVMIRGDGIVKVLDFGLAKLVEQNLPDTKAEIRMQVRTQVGVIMGTANYMSPEQARGNPVDARTDIFSLGCVIYEMLAGRQAFPGETVSHAIIAVLEKEPPPISLFVRNFPPEIERIVKKCLEKNIQARYQSAKDLMAELKKLKKRLEHEADLIQEEKITGMEEGRIATVSLIVSPAPTLAVSPFQLPSNNLTGEHSPIIGREKEIVEIKDLLHERNVRLLTLTGVGGAGKTRLAQAVARELLSDFPDGVFFIELAGVTSADLVASAIAQPLGLKESGGKPILEILKDHLRDKRILLVIDNFEQVIDAAPQIRDLLDKSRLQILITSRALLRLSAEREFVVPPLGVPPEIREVPLATLAGYDAIKLFVQRGQKAKSAFVLTEENACSVAEICALLDGLPLAIELAAARVKILSAQAILAKLDNSLRLLTGGARDLPARQQTVRGMVEWSYDLLTQDEKLLFRRLAVFAGGFSFEAAEAVCGGEPLEEQVDFLDLLTSLVDKSLLVTKERSGDGEPRFRMLRVVREYALESLEASDEAETMRRRHAEYFLAIGEEAEPHLQAVRGAEWLDRLTAEHENLRAALTWSLEKSPVEAARLAGAIRNFWAVRCHFTEGRKWLQAAIERGGPGIPGVVRFKILNGLGAQTRMQGDYAAARKVYEQGLSEGKTANDVRQIAHSNRGLGLVSFHQGDFGAARRFTEDGLASFRELGDDFGVALTLNSLGDLERAEGNTAAARRLLEESLEICQRTGNKAASGSTIASLGALSFEEGNFAAAYSYFADSLANAYELEDTSIVTISLDGFAALAAKRDKPALAARLAGAAQYLREKIAYEMEPIDRRFRDDYLAELKAAIDETAFSEFYEQGLQLNPDQLTALIKDLEN